MTFDGPVRVGRAAAEANRHDGASSVIVAGGGCFNCYQNSPRRNKLSLSHYARLYQHWPWACLPFIDGKHEHDAASKFGPSHLTLRFWARLRSCVLLLASGYLGHVGQALLADRRTASFGGLVKLSVRRWNMQVYRWPRKQDICDIHRVIIARLSLPCPRGGVVTWV